MGKFINIKVQQTVDTLTDGFKQTYTNPYYPFIDKGKTIITYLSQSKELSTLDEGNLKAYADRGSDSPIKFNKVNNVIAYGLEKISLSIELGEFGVESGDITGEMTLLPGLDPKPNDYFIINHYKGEYLFKITNVNFGTPEVENIYTVSYMWVKNNSDDIKQNIINEYEFVVNNIGTEYKAVLQKTEHNFIIAIEDIIDKLKNYYIDLFYNQRVEAFILEDEYQFIYDPALTEFIIRNKIAQGSNFIYFCQQLQLERTFSIEYDKTLFRAVEQHNKSLITEDSVCGYLDTINQPISILCMRNEPYYRMKYNPNSTGSLYLRKISIIDDQLLQNIHDDVTLSGSDAIENIIVNYFNNRLITKADIDVLNHIDYISNIRLFYIIPIVLYILEYNANTILKDNTKGGF